MIRILHRLFISASCAVFIAGCSSHSKTAISASAPVEETVVLSLQSPRLPSAELSALRNRASSGDAKAAFSLYSYYSLSEEGDAKRANQYFDLAVRLESPAALYLQAFNEWTHEEHPDVLRVERIIERAIVLGFHDEKGLLAEVQEAKRSGVIPRKSAFRFFL